MKAILYTLALSGMVLPLAACETLADTAPENEVRVSHAMIVDLKQVPDDAERMMLLDRPVWLSRYPIPND